MSSKEPVQKLKKSKVFKDLKKKIQKTQKALAAKATKKKIGLGLLLLALIGGLYYFKGLFVAALVNGQPISRLSVVRELEKRQGRGVLESFITEKLILQEANKQGLSVGQDETDAEIARIEKELEAQGQNLDQLLSFQNLTREKLKEQIYLQKLAEKMLAEKITLTEEEINEYLEANKDFLPQNSTPEGQKETAQEQLKQQKMAEAFNSWMAELKEKAKINYFVRY